MKTTFRRYAAVSACSFLPLVIPAQASDGDGADWPQWRGPDRTGISVETGWSPVSRDQSLWTKSIGFGHSSFAVSDGRLFAMGYDLERKLDVVYCLDPETGEEQWTHSYPSEFWNEGHDGGTCTTPAVEDGIVYTSNREGKLFALRADTGSVLWTRDMQAELEVKPPRWGFAGSPVVLNDTVVANVDKLASFEKSTGKLNWITEKGYGNAYSTPIEYDFKGRPSILVLNGLGLAVIDQADGSEIAFHSWTRSPEQAMYGSTPVIVDDRIFISASSGGGCVMLEPNADNGLDVVWESRVMRNSYAGSILYEDHLYGFDASILKCIDLEGNEKWRQRGIGVGAVIVVGGRLLVIGAKGELIIAEANPEKYVELSREKVLDGGAFWSTPVLSHGLAFARNSLGDMVCRDYRSGDGIAGVTRPELPSVLPDAATILADHVKAIGGADALRGVTALHLTGQGESHGGGPIEHCDAVLSWSADGGFAWRFSTGLDFGYNPQIGWNMSMGGPQILENDKIDDLREVGDLHRMLSENWGYESLETVESRVFDDRVCYVVSAELPGGGQRSLYFEVETGLLAGREGDDVPLWIFKDYQAAGDVKLPMDWSFFEPMGGSMIMAKFAGAALNESDASRHDPPTLITMMTRSDEEKEQANETLRTKYSELVGSYALATGSMTGTPLKIMIQEGGLRFSFAGQPPSYLTEPDEEGRVYDMTNLQIYIKIDRDDSGAVSQLRLFAYGDEFGRIDRVEED